MDTRPRNVPASGLGRIQRIALVYSPIISGVPLLTAVERVQRRPGLGLRYLKAVLQRAGVHVELFDNLYSPERAAQVHRELNRQRYDLVGFHTTSASRGHAVRTLEDLDRGWYAGRVMAGGPGSLHREELLEAGFDVVVTGEAEQTIANLVRAFEGKVSFEQVRGIAFMDDTGHTVATEPVEDADMDALPVPNWDDRDPLLGDMFNITLKRPYYTMMASRGCPYRCAFCSTHQSWRSRYRVRRPAAVGEELSVLVHEHGARYVHFLDDIFGLAPDWVDGFCDEIERRHLRFEFSVVLHPLSFGRDRRRLMARLRDVGCRLISFGAQSANGSILRGIGRSEREPEALRKAVATMKDLGLASVLTFIFGLPGDTDATINETIDYVNEVRPTLVDVHPLLYLPGSEIADRMPRERYCTLSDRDLNRWCTRAMVSYYVVNGGGARVLRWVVRHNPEWFWNLAQLTRYAAQYVGMPLNRRGTKQYMPGVSR